ncbi:hypothetical protein [Candidatus Mycoplasma haematohominis]|uniref:hypothetical protein n=1 Tax=Candidatus Mycoplasma haematohominis TaxID=1494318 RepID=UPI001C0A6FC5|nr:hypothetical protein [Candidatus Mycoplasma haemohominis]
MDPIKAAAGAGAVILASAGGYGISTLFEGEPICIQNPQADKFGEDFQFHFMDASDDKNDAWWKDRFNKKYPKNKTDASLHTDFQNLSGYSDLKDKCKAAYGKSTTSDVSKDTAGDHYEKNVWELCSIDGSLPAVITKTSETSKLFGSEKATKLIDTENEKNKKWWERRAKHFFKQGSKDGYGSKASENAAGFKKLHDDGGSVDDLKNKCQDNYGTAYDNSNISNTAKETLRFCSLAGKQT